MTFQTSKQFHVAGCKGAGDASTEQLGVINGYALKDMAAEEVYVRTMYLAHNGIDRDKEVMDDALLRDFARTLPGKGLFIKHPMSYDGDSGPGEGRFFASRVIEMSFDEARATLREPTMQWPAGSEKALLLEASFYTARTEDNKSLLTKIDAGVAGDVSIGFSASDRTPITDGSGDNENRIATRLHAPGEAYEGSLVWLGAQPGARIHKSATREEYNMDPKDKKIEQLEGDLKAAEQLVTETETKGAENKTKAATFDTVVKALGDENMKAETVVQLATDGKAYRDSLVEDIVTAKRHLKQGGDKDEDVTAAKALYDSWPLDAIKKEAAALTKQVPTGSSIDGGDPNNSGANEDDAQGKGEKVSDSGNPMKCSVIAGK